MNFRTLLSILIIERSNLEVLHWKAKGVSFDTMHNNVTTNLYEKVSDDIDNIAEISMRLGMNPVNYLDAYEEISKISSDIKILSADEDYYRDDIISIISDILRVIMSSILKVLASSDIQNKPINVGIKSNLEGMFETYDKEYRFLNARRKE